MAGKVPVVFAGVGDPLGSGFVASLARPGGNITGFVSFDGPMGGKEQDASKSQQHAYDVKRANGAISHPVRKACHWLLVQLIDHHFPSCLDEQITRDPCRSSISADW
jgi:hypothetical protein